MKAVILCGGKGTRLAPLSDNFPKQLLPIANRPVLFYIIDQIVDANIKEIGIVVSPDNISTFTDIIGDGKAFDIKIQYIMQHKPLGLAHAIKETRQFIDNSDFLVLLGDNLIQYSLLNLINKYNENNSDALILLREVVDPTRFGIAELGKNGDIIKLVEKPKKPKSNLAILGVYIFRPVIFEAIDSISPSWRGEYEITDAIQRLIDTGSTVSHYLHDSDWQDIGSPGDLLEANRKALEHYMADLLESKIEQGIKIQGKVGIGKNVLIKSSSIEGPVIIGDNCKIIDSSVGQFTSIGMNSVVTKTSLTNSIIMNDCLIENIDGLTDSVIGRKSHIYKGNEGNSARELIVGDESDIELR